MDLARLFADLATGDIALIAGAPHQVGVPAKEAHVGWPVGVVRRPDGDLIVTDFFANRLWRIDREGILHAFVGDGVPGARGDGGPAAQARLAGPHGLTQDGDGNLYVADLHNNTIRKIDYESGIITRVAGSGRRGRGGDGGPALEAEFDVVVGMAIDERGDLFLSAEWNNTIKRVDARSGLIEHFAGIDARHYPSERGTSRPFAGKGLEDWGGLTLGGYHGDGGPASDAGFFHPEHLAFDSKGDLYVCDNSNHRIRKIDMESGVITTVLGTGLPASNGDGGPATQAGTLMPDALFLDVYDNIYVGEKYGYRVRKVEAKTGLVSTLVGTGVPGFGEEGLPGSETRCNSCEAGIWADPDGTVLFCDCSGRVRRYDGQTGIVTTLLGGTSVHDGELANKGFLCCPMGISVGPDGHIFIADTFNQRIRAIDPHSGTIRTVAGNGARAYGGDNGPALEAYLCNPQDVSVDSQGRVVIADTRHAHVRRVEKDGIIRCLAGTAFQWDLGDGGAAIGACFIDVHAVAHGPGDDIYISDGVAGRVRKIDAISGIITTVAGTGIQGYSGDGGRAVEAQITTATALCFDADGNLFFTDSGPNVVRKVDAAGIITTLVGCGQAGFSADGTPASEARLEQPYGLALAKDGVIYISDTGNNRVRRVAADGTLETIAGGGEGGDRGTGGPAVQGGLNRPQGLCFYGDDILLVSDFFNNRIKAVKI